MLTELGGTWIAAPLTDGDREFAQAVPTGRTEGGFHLRLLDLPREEHRLHYDVVSNEYLWFLFHYLFDVPTSPSFDASFTQAWEAYRGINELYADAVHAAGKADAVIVQDYHLILVGDLLRRRSRGRRPLLYFHHTPWCEPDYLGLLPEAIAIEILEGMLAYDVVGFHAKRWARAFAACCDRFLKGVRVSDDAVDRGRRTTRIVVAPVPLDRDQLEAEAADPETEQWITADDEMLAGRKLLLRVDRIDLSKNPLRGFLAFEELLDRRPALAREVVFLALLYPSRLNVETYRRYFAECLGVVRRVNERYEGQTGSPDGPIQLSFQDQYHRSLAAMRASDVLLVNPVFDGLNLVAKEGAYVNQRSGSLILSRNAGVYEELARACIPVNPFDVTATVDAIESALEMPQPDRERRAKRLRTLAARSTPIDWARAQLSAAGLSF
jgi:trehalose 6-phosphate synthase